MDGSVRRSRDSGRLGVIMPEFRSPFFVEITRGIENRAALEGWSLIANDSMDDPDREAAQIEAAVAAGVAGILVVPAFSRVPSAALRAAGVPAVVIGTPVPGDEWPSVYPDDESGGWVAAHHLLDAGRRRILFVGGPVDAPFIANRLRGARRAVEEVDGARLLVIGTDGVGVEDGAAVGNRIVQLGRRPDAVFAVNDMVAIGVLQGASVHGGIHVPEELAIVGFDGIEQTATQPVPLSTVRQPRREIGAMAVELLLESLAGQTPHAVVMSSELVVRGSTATP